MTKENIDDANNIAKRISLLRQMTGLSRIDFSKKYNIHLSTINNWENGNFKLLSSTAAEMLRQYLQNEGIICTTEWILLGTGTIPDTSHLLTRYTKSKNTIELEINQFKTHYNDAVIIEVKTDLLAPFIEIGDFIGALPIKIYQISSLINKLCVLRGKATEIGILLKDKEKQSYLLKNNLNGNATTINLKNLEIAKIIWLRKPN